MKKNFNKLFTIINQDLYNLNKDNYNCQSCKTIIIDPKLCKNCRYMYCNTCSLNNLNCPKCLNYPLSDITRSKKLYLDKIKLLCKLNSEIPLSELISHMNKCPNTKNDKYLQKKRLRGNTKLITVDNDINLSKVTQTKKSKGNNNISPITLKDSKLKEKSLNSQIVAIKSKLKRKKAIITKMKKLERNLNKGETVKVLQQKLKEKNMKLKELKGLKGLKGLQNKKMKKKMKNNINQKLTNEVKEIEKVVESENNEEFYKKIIKTNPNNSNALNDLGRLLRDQGKEEEAENTL